MEMNTELKNEKQEKKAEGTSRQAEYKRQRHEADKKAAQSILDKVAKANIQLTKEEKAFLDSYASYDPNASRQNTFAVLFPNAKVGDKITLEKAMHLTLKGLNVINKYVENWKEKGIVVECAYDSKEPLKSVYTVKALPSA